MPHKPKQQQNRISDVLSDRFVLLPSALGLTKTEFGRRIGITSQQFSNIQKRRAAPSHDMISATIREFGLTADYFYQGVLYGIRNPELARWLDEKHSGCQSAD